MRLLIVTQVVDRNHPILGFFYEWLEEFKKHPGVESLEVICSQVGEGIPGVRITNLGKKNKIGKIIKFLKAIWKSDADAVLVHMIPIWVIVGWIIWKAKGVQVNLWYTHGMSSCALRVAYTLVRNIFTASKKSFPFSSYKVHVMGHGLSKIFSNINRLPRPENRFAFLFVGRLSPRKKVIETIELFSKVVQQEPRATLMISGPDDPSRPNYGNQVKERIEELRLQDRITMSGAVPHAELPNIFAQHDCLIHLSETGSLDKVAMESLASGCAVFSTNKAIGEALGEKWEWKGDLDKKAVDSLILRASIEVDEQDQLDVIGRFTVKRLIYRLVQKMV